MVGKDGLSKRIIILKPFAIFISFHERKHQMSKSIINSILKEHGLCNVRVTTTLGGRVIRVDNKIQKGIYCGTISPVDCFNYPRDNAKKLLASLKGAILAAGFVERDGYFVAKETSRSILKLHLSIQEFRKYSSRTGYDENYKQLFIVHRYEQVKK